MRNLRTVGRAPRLRYHVAVAKNHHAVDAIDFAIVSLASRFVVEDGVVKEASLVAGGVAPVPYALPETEQFLIGKKITKEVAKEAGEIAMKDATPMRENAYKVFMEKDTVYEAVCRAGGIEKQEIPVL